MTKRNLVIKNQKERLVKLSQIINYWNEFQIIFGGVMLIKDLSQCLEFAAGDNTKLRVVLHPDHDSVQISYSFAHAIVKSGETSYLHQLSTSEAYYILQGEGIMHIDQEDCAVFPNQLIFIPPNSKQNITCTSEKDLVFLCIVDPAWKVENEVIL